MGTSINCFLQFIESQSKKRDFCFAPLVHRDRASLGLRLRGCRAGIGARRSAGNCGQGRAQDVSGPGADDGSVPQSGGERFEGSPMTEPTIICPNSKTEIKLTELLNAPGLRETAGAER